MGIPKFSLVAFIFLFFSSAHARDFVEGQVWSYKTRAQDKNSTLLINKVEKDPKLGIVYHISVYKVLLKNPEASSKVSTDLPHFPVSKETLEKSCVQLTGSAKPNPEYRQAYTLWKQAAANGEASVFTISVAEIVDAVEMTLGK